MFLQQLCELDKDKRIQELAWENYAGKVRVFIDNRYVCRAYWEFQRGLISEEEAEARFQSGKKIVQQALGNSNTAAFLSILFERLYILRNQIMHGGATWNSQTKALLMLLGASFVNATPFFTDFSSDPDMTGR